LHLGLFIAAFVLSCGFAELLAIVPGTGISIWPASGLFIATLVLTPRQSWPWWVLAGCFSELFSNVLWFHSPLAAAFLIYCGNALEAVIGAWLVNRACSRPVRLESLRDVLAFVLLGAGVAPVASATVGSATLAWFDMQGQSFATAWPLWWIGDATGVLIVAPLALVVLQNWHGKAHLSPARWMEAGVLGLILLGVAILSMSGALPFAYIIMPPLLWAAVRFEFKGAAVALILLALITAVFTIHDTSQFAGNPEALKHNQVMLQLFLAISAFSALIVAAISRQHQLAALTLLQSERSLREHVEALRLSEQRLQQMIDAVPIRLWRATATGESPYFNKRYRDYLRSLLPDFDAIEEPQFGQLMLELMHPEDAPEMAREMRRCFASGATFAMRFRRLQKNGSYRWEEGRAEPLRDHDGKIVQWYGVALDIDDEIRAQEGLRQASDKLARANQAASLAELSASIAHEVNQPLAAIVANSHACQRWLMADPPNIERAQKTVQRVIRDANAAAEVVRRVHALFKQSMDTRVPTAFDSVIAEARDLMAEEAARRGARMDFEVETGLPLVAMDRVQVQQVLINLMRNGMDAMESMTRGRVLRARARRIGEVVQTEISDRGPGIEFPDRIFEPFFTTKESGMGMGLAICRSIVESHGGRLWVEKNEPQGANFIFTLPIEAKTASDGG